MTNTQTLGPAQQLAESNKAHYPMKAQSTAKLAMRSSSKRLSCVGTSNVWRRNGVHCRRVVKFRKTPSLSPSTAPLASPTLLGDKNR